MNHQSHALAFGTQLGHRRLLSDTCDDNLHPANLAIDALHERTMLTVPIDPAIVVIEQVALNGPASGLWTNETQPDVTLRGDRCGATCGQALPRRPLQDGPA